MYRRSSITATTDLIADLMRRVEILEATTTRSILNADVSVDTGISLDEAQALIDTSIADIDISATTGDFAPVDHTHPLSDIEQSGAAVGEIPTWNGSSWTPTSPAASSETRTSPQRVVNSSGGILLSDRLILCEQTGPITLTLPTGASTTDYFNVIDIDGVAATHNITINASAGTTINGASSVILDINYMSLSIGFDGSTRWFIF